MTDSGASGGSFQESARAKADELAGQAQQLGDSLQARATDEADARSTQAGEELGAVGDVMRGASRELRARGNELPAAIADQVADRADRFGHYLRQSSGEKLMNDAQDFARQQPWVVAALGLAAGLAVARLLKASGRRGYPGTYGAPQAPGVASAQASTRAELPSAVSGDQTPSFARPAYPEPVASRTGNPDV
jgi:ElaB/YqjD/DUF883 family membrane-anchored ribosome-binding protein